ncbi:hypothetical protein ACIBO5_45395 [Nonomuraea angiospora]|uniref:hypothetical protein n=1 Tax=Nonomuraea angiospora TaxID=46172 RepID=UPI0037A5D7F3
MTLSLVVVYDGACGSCSSIAATLSQVLTVPVIVRSCRDPHLTREFPLLEGIPRCVAPLAVMRGPDGAATLLRGLRLMWRGAGLIAPGRYTAAVRLAGWIAWQRLLHLAWPSRRR